MHVKNFIHTHNEPHSTILLFTTHSTQSPITNPLWYGWSYLFIQFRIIEDLIYSPHLSKNSAKCKRVSNGEEPVLNLYAYNDTMP